MSTLTTPAPQIAVLDRGFVYVGLCTVEDGTLVITRARNVRRWGTSVGLGELAANGAQPQTRLDATCTVRAPMTSVMHLIDCDPAAWPDLAA